MEWKLQTSQNNLGSSLYTILSAYYMVATLEDGAKSKESEY